MADTVVQELVINTLTQAQFDAAKEAGTLSPYELYGTPDTSIRLPVLTPMWFDHISNDMSWLRADTFSWHSGDVYKAAYEHLVGDLETAITLTDTIGDITITYYLTQDGHKICLPDQESNLRAVMQATGVAWYYILDTENKQFKLPRTKYGFTGLRDSVGGYVESGLPNITGAFQSDNAGFGGSVATGAFRTDTSTTAKVRTTGNNSCNPRVYFDASLSSSVYGNSDTVQPPATQMHLYFYVGAFGQTATEQTAGLNAETINGKADSDFGNILNSAKELMANASMPSGTYIDLTLGTTGTKYTAPADGWFFVSKKSSGNGQYLTIGNDTANFAVTNSQDSGFNIILYLPASAGDIVNVSYNVGGTTNAFRFIYANGAKHLA